MAIKIDVRIIETIILFYIIVWTRERAKCPLFCFENSKQGFKTLFWKIRRDRRTGYWLRSNKTSCSTVRRPTGDPSCCLFYITSVYRLQCTGARRVDRLRLSKRAPAPSACISLRHSGRLTVEQLVSFPVSTCFQLLPAKAGINAGLQPSGCIWNGWKEKFFG